MCKVSPAVFIKISIDHLKIEDDELILNRILPLNNYIMNNFIQDKDKNTLSEQLFTELFNKFQTVKSLSLKSQIIDKLFELITTKE